MKVILNLWDGVRFDAIFKVNEWKGLPNLFNLINSGVLYTNCYTAEPAITPVAVARIMKNQRGKWITSSLWQKMRKKSTIVGYPEEGKGRIHVPHSDFVDCVYDRVKERRLKQTKAGRELMRFHRMHKPDKLRMDIACKKFPDYDFTFVYFPEPDSAAHECRDSKKHIYHRGSPYVNAIKNCDVLLGHMIKTLNWCAKNDYIYIIVADHGMSDNGRHSIGKWTDKEIMQVPLIVFGKGIRKGWYEQAIHHTHQITSGIVGLFKGDARNTMFKYALNAYANPRQKARR